MDYSLGIAKIEDENEINEITSVSIEVTNDIKNKYPMLVDYVGTYYYSNFEEQMIDMNQFYLGFQNYNYSVSHINIRSINDYLLYEDYDLLNDEIILGIDAVTLNDIAKRINVNNSIYALKDYILNNSITGIFSFANLSWEYEKTLELKIKDIVLLEKNSIIHSSSFWNEHILENELKLVPSFDLTINNKLPWMIKKVYYVKVDIQKSIDILNVFLNDINLNSIWFDYLEIPSFNTSYILDDNLSGRIILTNQTKDRISHAILNELDLIMKIHQEKGYQVIPYRIEAGKSVAEALDDLDETYRYILIAGGDGTVDSVVNAMMNKKIDMPIGILPVGTANDFGKFINIPNNVEQALELILSTEPVPVDIGKINDKYFVNVASTGLFTDISQKTDDHLKNTIGKLAYYIKGLEE